MQQHFGAYGIQQQQSPSPYGVAYQQPPRTSGTTPPPPQTLRTGTTPLAAAGLSPQQQPYHTAAVLPSPTATTTTVQGASPYATGAIAGAGAAARGGYAKAEPLGVPIMGVGVDPNAPSSPQYMTPGGGAGVGGVVVGTAVGTGAISPGNASTASSAQSHAAAQGNGAVSVSPGVSASTSPTFSRVRAISRGACGETWLVQCATPGVPQGACTFGGVVPGSGSSPVPGAVYSRSPTTSTSTGGSSVCAVGTSFAMKVMKLKREGRSTEKLRQRSYQEVECLRKCQHPLVVGYIDHRENEQDMEFELVMELVEGGDLNLQIAVRAAASHYYLEAEALFYFVQACVSLRSLHRRNLLHRDIKAGNFLCLRNGLLKLADFGFARDFSPQNVVGQRVCSEFMGTPSFMAPEVWKREGYGDRAEVWSLGIMLYQLLTLELPFQGSTLESLSRRVCRGTYKEIPETLRVSSHTRALLASMLAVEPEKRPSLEEILQTPLMRRALRQFKHLCAQNNFLPPDQIAECD